MWLVVFLFVFTLAVCVDTLGPTSLLPLQHLPPSEVSPAPSELLLTPSEVAPPPLEALQPFFFWVASSAVAFSTLVSYSSATPPYMLIICMRFDAPLH